MHTLLLTVGVKITNQQHYDPLFIMFASEFIFTVQIISSYSSILSDFFSITVEYGSQIPSWFHFAVLWEDQDRRHWDWLSHDNSAMFAAQSTFLAGLASSGWNRLEPVFSVLTAEPKGQEIITQKTFLAKVTLIENYINHLEGKKFQLMPSVCGITSISVSVLDF